MLLLAKALIALRPALGGEHVAAVFAAPLFDVGEERRQASEGLVSPAIAEVGEKQSKRRKGLTPIPRAPHPRGLFTVVVVRALVLSDGADGNDLGKVLEHVEIG
jgi:hypothetical protein